MTREREDELLAELRGIREQANRMIQRVVDARVAGQTDTLAIAELEKLSKRQSALTQSECEAA